MLVVRSAVCEDLPDLACVLVDAFQVKMRVLFGRDTERTTRVLQSLYFGPIARGYDGVMVAELDGHVVGGLVIDPLPWTQEDVARLDQAIRQELSWWRRFWNRVGYSTFSHGPEAGDAYISDVGVHSNYRGRGIAQALMVEAEHWAVSHQRCALALWVASNNHIARHVYEKIGMKALREERNIMSGLLYGIPRWAYMRKVLGHGEADC